MDTKKRVMPRCTTCRSVNVFSDAFAEWDTDTQRWVLSQCFQQMHCGCCDGPCQIEWVVDPAEYES